MNNTVEYEEQYEQYRRAVFEDPHPLACEEVARHNKPLLQVSWNARGTRFAGCAPVFFQEKSTQAFLMWEELHPVVPKEGFLMQTRTRVFDQGLAPLEAQEFLFLKDSPVQAEGLAYFLNCLLPPGVPNPNQVRSPLFVMQVQKDAGTGRLRCGPSTLLPEKDPRFLKGKGWSNSPKEVFAPPN